MKALPTPSLVAFTIALLLTTAFSGLLRPLWIDEFLHFSLAGVSWSRVFEIIQLTTPTVNHGQTWFYQVASVSILKFTGASLFGVRVISWVATFVTLYVLYLCLRVLGVSIVYWFLLVSFMVAIPQISFEMGNGRPYLLLVMATILYVYGLLDFLVGEGRKVWPRFLYALGVLVGSLSHPYFPVIMVLVTGGFFLFRNMYLGESLKQHLARGYFYWGLSVAGGLLAIYVGTLTWMVGSSDFSNFDPFESFLRLGIPVGVREFLVASVALLVLSVAGIFSGYRLAVRGQLSLPLVVGLGLVGIGLTFSLLVSWISYLRHYWILPRQWLPGAIIFFLGIVILLSVLIKKVSRSNVRTSVVAARLLSGIAGLGIALGFFIELDAQARHQQFWSNLSEAELRSYLGDENAFYVYASNLNLHCGGTVWPELEQYYSGGGSADSVASIALRYRECAER